MSDKCKKLWPQRKARDQWSNGILPFEGVGREYAGQSGRQSCFLSKEMGEADGQI